MTSTTDSHQTLAPSSSLMLDPYIQTAMQSLSDAPVVREGTLVLSNSDVHEPPPPPLQVVAPPPQAFPLMSFLNPSMGGGGSDPSLSSRESTGTSTSGSVNFSTRHSSSDPITPQRNNSDAARAKREASSPSSLPDMNPVHGQDGGLRDVVAGMNQPHPLNVSGAPSNLPTPAPAAGKPMSDMTLQGSPLWALRSSRQRHQTEEALAEEPLE